MTVLAKPWHTPFSESWLAFNRVLTAQVLESRIRKRASERCYEPDPGSVLYVAASCLPYHISGYTARTHEVISALRAIGGSVHALTRPGYPGDRSDRLSDAAGDQTLVGDVRYQHTNRPANNRPALFYALQAASVVAEMATRKRVEVIHAASNHVNALPALLAARQLGIPFQYEMRGLWELTRISRQPDFEGLQAYRQGLQLEGLVARSADRLFVISQQLGRYAQDHWNVSARRMALLPNCVDPDRIVPADLQRARPLTIGYAGSLITYEGLDTLIDAVDVLAREGSPLKVEVIGDGEVRAQLEAQVDRLGLRDRIAFFGRVPPDRAREILGRCALVCIPRKPFKVCEIVPPLKLVEAMAMGKPVIVPDLPVFRDEMGTNPAGWFFKAGDALSLASVLRRALADQDSLAALSVRAREYATTQRCWKDFVVNVLPTAGEV